MQSRVSPENSPLRFKDPISNVFWAISPSVTYSCGIMIENFFEQTDPLSLQFYQIFKINHYYLIVLGVDLHGRH